jgi:hypothetical protein
VVAEVLRAKVGSSAGQLEEPARQRLRTLDLTLRDEDLADADERPPLTQAIERGPENV